ncbi:MAG: LPXTG cell wall anchor domain-containing protein [Lachnospiraceae bacterium]|nr:LPXTG cell wall anchor domain-containing protein [Lachnospiraceae bacterium]
MPETGGAGTNGYFLAGAALCGGAGMLLYRRRRKLRV